jgi:voltage-dependent potassium channel beta subunit
MPKKEMTYRSMGTCGMKVSTYSIGGWTTFGESIKDLSLTKKILSTAIEGGMNYIDLADIYACGECELAAAKVLKDFPRHELVIASKTFWPMSEDINDRGLSRKHIMESVEKSLRRMETDYFDIYYCHRFDPETPMEETIRAMDDLIHQGKVLYWGTSEWRGWQISEAVRFCERHGLYKPQVEQPEYSLLYRGQVERDVAPVAQALGIGVVVWSPLGSGVLTGKYDEGIPKDSRVARMGADQLPGNPFTEENIARVKKMKKIADELGCTRAQLALAWAAAQPGITSVITGATKVEQVKDNLGALEIEITEQVKTALDGIFPVVLPQ